MALENIDKMPKTTFKAAELLIITERVLLLFITISCSGVRYIWVINMFHFPRASKKHQFSTKTIKTKTNSTFKSWKCCFYADFLGDCILTRGLTESVLFAPKPRNSKVLALLTVNSPVDCLRIELIIKPLPKKAPIFRCFFPLFTLFYGDFTCFSQIDKTTAHGLFHTPQNRGGSL